MVRNFKVTSKWLTFFNFLPEIRAHLTEEIAAQEQDQEFGLAAVEDEAEEKRIMELNDLWNTKISTEREIRLAHEIIDFYEDRNRDSTLFQEEFLENLQKRETEVEQIKGKAGLFVTADTLDAEIEKLLDSEPVAYNFAIDNDGSMLIDKAIKPYIRLSVENSKSKSQKVVV